MNLLASKQILPVFFGCISVATLLASCKSRNFGNKQSSEKSVLHYADKTYLRARDEVIFVGPTSVEEDPYLCLYGGQYQRDFHGEDTDALFKSIEGEDPTNLALYYALQAELLPQKDLFDLETVVGEGAAQYKDSVRNIAEMTAPIKKSVLLNYVSKPLRLEIRQRELAFNHARIKDFLRVNEFNLAKRNSSFFGVVDSFFNKVRRKSDKFEMNVETLRKREKEFQRARDYIENVEIPFCQANAMLLKPLLTETANVRETTATMLKSVNLAAIETHVFSDKANAKKTGITCPSTYGEYLEKYDPTLLASVKKSISECKLPQNQGAYFLNFRIDTKNMTPPEIEVNAKYAYKLLRLAQKRCLKGQSLFYCAGLPDSETDTKLAKEQLEKMRDVLSVEVLSDFGFRDSKQEQFTPVLRDLFKVVRNHLKSLSE